jgi:hypothetical protein
MREKYYYCYSTDNELLGHYAKKIIEKQKNDPQKHNITSVLSTIQSISSLLIDTATSSISISIENPYYKKEKLAKKFHFNLKLRPLEEYNDDFIDEIHEFKQVTKKMTHDNFSEFNDELYGQVLKYTSYLHLDIIDIDNKKQYNDTISNLIISLLIKIKDGVINREEKFQIPIGKQLFNIKMNCSIIY